VDGICVGESAGAVAVSQSCFPVRDGAAKETRAAITTWESFLPQIAAVVSMTRLVLSGSTPWTRSTASSTTGPTPSCTVGVTKGQSHSYTNIGIK